MIFISNILSNILQMFLQLFLLNRKGNANSAQYKIN